MIRLKEVILLIILFFPLVVSAQQKTITLKINETPVPELLRMLEKQAGVKFSFESSLLDKLPEKSLDIRNETLAACLDKIFRNTWVEYKISGNHVILKRKTKLVSISGYVMDADSKETLIGAGIYDTISRKGTIANDYGFYSISLPAGTVASLHISYVGYLTRDEEFVLTKDTVVNFRMLAGSMLKEVVIEGRQGALNNVQSTRMGTLSLSPEAIKNVPAILGEVDMIKVLQQTPGVSVGTEGFSGMYVRGGNKDENLYLLDGNPIYDINHLMGFLSTFNPDAIKSTEFYKSSFPARYSGRLSSVVDVRTKDGNMKEYHGVFSVGLLSAKMQVEGPIIKDKTSFNVSYRRSYIDLLTTPLIWLYNKSGRKDGEEQDQVTLGYHFYDLNAKINHKFSDRSRLYLNIYSGEDACKTGYSEKYDDYNYNYDTETGQYTKTDYLYTEYSKDLFKWKWGNLVTSLNWNYVFNSKLFGNANLVYTKYGSDINYLQRLEIIDKNKGTEIENSRLDMNYSSGIEDIGARIDFDYMPHVNHAIKFGTSYLYHTFRPEESGLYSRTKAEDEYTTEDTAFHNSNIKAHELSVYAEDEINLSSRLKVNVGLNMSVFEVQGKTYPSIQPRVSARYLLKDNFSVKASYTNMSQYVHLLSTSYLNLPTDLLVPVTPHIAPQRSNQVSAGLYYNLKKEWDFSLEAYYKTMNKLIEYKDGAALISSSTDWQKRVAVGNGRAYGIELMAQRKIGKITGWAGYALSWSDRQFPGGEINQGNRYWSKYDNRHKFNIVANYKIKENMDINASWTYATGNRMTLVTEAYEGVGLHNNYIDPRFNPYGGYSSFGSGSVPYVESRNNYKLGDYHRLDLGINFYRPKKNGRMGIWNISVYNVYCRMNPFFAYPSAETIYNSNGTSTTKYGLSQVAIFPFVPSFSYTYKF